ncbi:MAG: lysozyme [Alphaproteobacteria bacterium]
MSREINEAGLALIKEFEGCELRAYPDPGTGGEPFTIGFGHVGPEVRPGTVWTQERADRQLEDDVRRFSRAVDEAIGVAVSGNEFSAMVCLAFNIGAGAFARSTLARLVNEGRMAAAADQFLRWDKAGGNVMAGLTRRRTAERELFLTPG